MRKRRSLSRLVLRPFSFVLLVSLVVESYLTIGEIDEVLGEERCSGVCSNGHSSVLVIRDARGAAGSPAGLGEGPEARQPTFTISPAMSGTRLWTIRLKQRRETKWLADRSTGQEREQSNARPSHNQERRINLVLQKHQ